MRANAYTLGMFKPTVVSVLLCVVTTLAQAQTAPDALLEGCNALPDPAKRLACFKAAQASATPTESRQIMPGGVLPARPGNNDKDWVGNATMSPDGSRSYSSDRLNGYQRVCNQFGCR